jgi:hypothetical protein
MPHPKKWLQRSEWVMTIGAFLLVGVAYLISRLASS